MPHNPYAALHPAITWNSHDSIEWSSVMCFGIHLRTISKEMLKICIFDKSLKIINYPLIFQAEGVLSLPVSVCLSVCP